MSKNSIDLADELGVEAYCKKYEEKNMPWGKAERALFNEALDFVFGQELPENGKCIEVGVYKGESFLRLVEKYGLGNCMGIDVKNYANLPNITVTDIRKFNQEMPVRLGINDISHTCPNSKLYAHNWLNNNLVKDGLMVLTGYMALELKKYNMENLAVIYQNHVVIVFKKLV